MVRHFKNLPAFAGQMDFHVTHWDTTNSCVTTRYYNSEFMDKASAQDIEKN